VKSALSSPFSSFNAVTYCIESLFYRLGGHNVISCSVDSSPVLSLLCAPLLKQLLFLHEQNEGQKSLISVIDHCISTAVTCSLGNFEVSDGSNKISPLENLMKILTINDEIKKNIDKNEIKPDGRYFLLPIFRDSIHHTPITDFINYFFPLASVFLNQTKQLENQKKFFFFFFWIYKTKIYV
jgi:hypothetical protein